LILNRIGGWAKKPLLHSLAEERAESIMNFNWKRLLGFSQDDVLGLDIGSSSVRMIQLAKSGNGYTVVAAHVCDIKQDGVDAAAREESIVQAVKKCMVFARKNARWAVCSVSGPEVAVRPFKFPPLQTEELDGAVRLEASQVCPFNVDDGVVDYQIVPSESDNASAGVLVAASNDVIRRKIGIIEKANMSCVMMDVDGLALLNCLIAGKNADTNISTMAVLDIGTSCTTLAVMGETGLPFVRTVPYAGNDIVDQIAKENNVSSKSVEDELYGLASPTIAPENLQASMEKASRKLVSDVAETLRYHNSTQAKSSPVEQLLVCGTFGMVKGFVDILSKQLPIKVVLWNPFDTMKCSVDRQCLEVVQSKGPAMVVAAGLAMRSV
jgi:type IV pilus assembly protein PilM